jgi:hypothetical protein
MVVLWEPKEEKVSKKREIFPNDSLRNPSIQV